MAHVINKLKQSRRIIEFYSLYTEQHTQLLFLSKGDWLDYIQRNRVYAPEVRQYVQLLH